MKYIFFIFISSLIISCQDVEKDASDANLKVDSLLSEMTLREKIGQMNQYSVGSEMTGPNASVDHAERYQRFLNGEVGSVLNTLGARDTRKLQKMVVDSTRLGIPLIFAYDVIHGYQTMFPIPLGEAASWDLEAIQLSASIAAKEASSAGIQWTFAPMVDISRDARWGRVMEGAGEDPYLGSLIAKARIKGFQGNDLSDKHTIAACAKHFAGYGFAESGKDYNSVTVGKNTLHNVILPPFRASVESNVATFMNAFNDIDGIPSTSNLYLLRELLADKWNFDGVVVSDWNSIGEIINHGVASDRREAAMKAAIAGCDVDMEGDAFVNHLEQLILEGQVSEDLVDESVRQILSLKYELGLFDNPYKYFDEEIERELIGHPAHKKISREVATKSIVLLKNEQNLLPLANVKKLGVIGPLAKDKDSPLGNWRAAAKSNTAISLYEGIQTRLGNQMQISYAEGCKLSIGPNNFFNEVQIEQNDKSGFEEAIRVARTSDVVIMALGETAYMSGEARSRADIGLPGLQLDLLKEIYKVNKNIVLVLMNGRPLSIPWEADNIPTIVEAWHLGSEAGNAIADVLSGDVNPSGKLPMSFPRHVGQLPLYYNHLNTGRPNNEGAVFYSHHMDVENTPLYPFGYGLSYSEFEYSDLVIKQSSEEINVLITVTNTSDVYGQEVVQVYIRDIAASISRPVLELKGFEKIGLEPGQAKQIRFQFTKEDLSYFDTNGNTVFESGEFLISVGSNSQDLISESITL
ncbi:MAG: beta-glucosidase BglX [Ekhidna sp.]